MTSMFQNATNFNQPIGMWNTANVQQMGSLFDGATNFNQPIGAWNTAKVTTMAYLFRNAKAFNQNINTWNTAKLTGSLRGTFLGATSFNQPLDAWDVSRITDMNSMFSGATAFNQNINAWNTSKVTNMFCMFYGATNFNQPLDNWDTSKVTTMQQMFYYARAFNQPIDTWNTSKVTNMASMFYGATAFNQPIGGWDTSKVTTMASMFNGAAAFNQPIGAWDTSKVVNMSAMFSAADSFDQNLGTWKLDSVTTNATNFTLFSGGSAGLSVANYDATLIGWFNSGVKNGLQLDAGKSQYCIAENERAALMNTSGWVIKDGVGRPSKKGCPPPQITFNAPTKLKNGPITDTTVTVLAGYNGLVVNAADVQLDPGATTATVENFSCHNVSPIEVTCTMTITTSGNVRVTATNSGETQGSAIERNYIIDTTPPVLTSMQIDTTTHGLEDPIFTFSTWDNIAVDYVDVIYTPTYGGLTTTQHNVTSPLQLQLDPNELAAVGYYTVTFRVYDTAGNMTENVFRFPPIINITAPTVISNTTINNATVKISSPLGNPIKNIALSGATGATIGTCTDANGGIAGPEYAQPITCTIVGVSSTGDVIITAQDAVTGATGRSIQHFIIETTPPAIAINAPVKKANHAITSVTVKVSDDVQILASDVLVAPVNTTGGFSISNVVCTQVDNSHVDCTLQIDDNEGTGDLQVTAKDVAGNTTVRTETGFVIDRTPPTVPQPWRDGDATKSDHTSTNNPQPSIVVTCAEADEIIELFVDGAPAGTHTCTALGDVSIPLLNTLADGTYIVTYTGTDSFGNSATSPELHLTIDTVAPVVTVKRADGQAEQTNVNHAQFTVQTSKPVAAITAGDLIVAGTNSGVISSIEKISDTEWRITVSNLTDGDRVMLGTVDNLITDTAGNVAAGVTPDVSESVLYIAPVTPNTPDTPDAGVAGTIIGSVSAVALVLVALMGILAKRRRSSDTA